MIFPATYLVKKVEAQIKLKMFDELLGERLKMSRKNFVLEEIFSSDRFSILCFSTSNWRTNRYYITTPDPTEDLVSGLIMEGLDWNLYTSQYLPECDVILDAPAYVSPDVLADNPDIPFTQYAFGKADQTSASAA